MSQPAQKKSIVRRIADGSAATTIVAIIIGFLIGAVALAVAGYNPLDAYGDLFNSIFKSPKNMSYAFIEYATPLIFTGLSVAFAFKTGIFNIGAEGQFVMGSAAAMLVGVFVKAPAIVHIPLCILTAMLVGMLWGGLVGWLKVRFGSHEVLCMIMFNWIAYYFSNFLVNTKLVNVGGGKTWSQPIEETAHITFSKEFMGGILSPKAHFGIILALIAVVVIWYLIDKTTLGYRLKAVGFNRNAAEYAGIDANKNIMLALAISGALAALGGACQVLGVMYKVSQFAGQESYGFNGITVALMGATNPFGVLLSGLFYGAMRFGGTKIDPPSEIVDIIMGCIVFFIAISNLLRSWISNHRKAGA